MTLNFHFTSPNEMCAIAAVYFLIPQNVNFTSLKNFEEIITIIGLEFQFISRHWTENKNVFKTHRKFLRILIAAIFNKFQEISIEILCHLSCP